MHGFWVLGVWNLTRKRWEAVFSLLVGLASAAIVLLGDQAAAAVGMALPALG